MPNLTKCKNCGAENPYHQLKCVNCQSFLRRRVVNIELWETIGKVIESPSKGFENIIFAEHKNFLILMTIMFAVSILFDLNFASNYLFETSLLSKGIILFGLIIAFSIINAILLQFIFLGFGNKTRVLDNLYLIIFANIPQIFSLIILLPVQLALFGEHWFTFNPSPFLIKISQSYILFGIEGLLTFWSIILLFLSFKVETNNSVQSFLATFISIIMIYILPLITIHNLF